MAEGINSFGAGMNQDISHSKRDPNSYFSMRNFRILTSDGSSSGSITTEQGTSLSFKVPDTTSITLSDGTIIPAQSGLKIIGSASLVDELIIFTTKETSVTPNGYGQIWKCKYDENTESIIGLTGSGFLDQNVHLFYNQKLNFSTEYRIGRAVALYESTKKQRVYWTDNYNNVRTFNLAVDSPLDTPLETVDVFSSIYLTQPVFKSIGSGSLPVTSQIQFTYRLIDVNGAETAFAPATPLIPMPDVVIDANNFSSWDTATASGGKSITYNLNNIDTSYSAIQHIAIVYNTSGTTIYNFAEDSVPTTGSLDVTCSTLSGAVIITPEEYSIINTGFTKCKDIEVKDGRLVAANISTEDAELNFDARSYRFNNPLGKYQPVTPTFPLSLLPVTPIALLRDSNDNNLDKVLLGGTNTTDYDSIPDTHDCINIYNKEQEIDWYHPDQQYKYKRDGITLGGSGKNISYEFVTTDMVGNYAFGIQTNAPNHIMVTGYPDNNAPKTKGVLEEDGTPQTISIENQIANNASVWAHSEYVNHARGEVYRYGIVLYNKKGAVTFTDWIGDIKFPDVADGYPLQEYVDGVAILKTLGIRFTVDVSSVADKISGYSIVRLKREESDKTRLGSGFFMFFDFADPAQDHSLMHRYWSSGIDNGAHANDPSRPFPVTGDIQTLGNDDHIIHLSDRPGFTNLTTSSDVYKRIGYLVSPLGNIYNCDKTSSDYIETLEYYNAELHNYWSYDPDQTKADYAFYYKMKGRVTAVDIAGKRERIQVDDKRDLYTSEYLSKSHSFMSNLDTSVLNTNNLGNVSYCREKAALTAGANELVPLGCGNPKMALKLKLYAGGAFSLPPTINHMSTSFTWQGTDNWNGPTTGTTLGFGGNFSCDTDVRFKSVGYRRYLDNQYKGASYETRSKDRYTYIGHFQVVKDSVNSSLSFDVYGGDTYVNYHDNEYLQRYNNDEFNTEQVYKTHGRNELGIAICGPVETSINTNYTSGTNWASNRSSTDMDFYTKMSESYNTLWNAEDTATNKFFSNDFLSSLTTYFPNRIWASEIKINGELSDQWRNFPIANKTDVEGIYGPINRIINFQGKLLFYQDKAFGDVALNDRSVIQDQTGQELVLGTGGVFPYYNYHSINTGSFHQFAVLASDNAVYHYDARLNKFHQFSSNGLVPLSDVKGMSSYFKNNITGDITTTDKTTRYHDSKGVHGIYDIKNNRVLYTFLKGGRGENDETIGFNELTGSFESFYDYFPQLYLEYGRRMFSVSPINNNELHTHSGGAPGVYYDTIFSKSVLHTVFTNPSYANKIFNNMSYNAELYSTAGNDVFNQTFDKVTYSNNYQTTGPIPLVVDGNIKRRMRTWHTTIGRDISTPLSRMRNHWLDCVLEFTNNNGLKHTVHDITYSFTPVKL